MSLKVLLKLLISKILFWNQIKNLGLKTVANHITYWDIWLYSALKFLTENHHLNYCNILLQFHCVQFIKNIVWKSQFDDWFFDDLLVLYKSWTCNCSASSSNKNNFAFATCTKHMNQQRIDCQIEEIIDLFCILLAVMRSILTSDTKKRDKSQ